MRDMNEYLAGLERPERLRPFTSISRSGPMVANPRRLLTRYLKLRKNVIQEY